MGLRAVARLRHGICLRPDRAVRLRRQRHDPGAVQEREWSAGSDQLLLGRSHGNRGILRCLREVRLGRFLLRQQLLPQLRDRNPRVQQGDGRARGRLLQWLLPVPLDHNSNDSNFACDGLKHQSVDGCHTLLFGCSAPVA